MLHVVQVSFLLDPNRSPEQILRDWWPLVLGADMVAQAGAQVTVIQACVTDQRIRLNGVCYVFIAPDRGRSTIATGARLRQVIADIDPDVLHVHGLGFPDDVVQLAAMAPRTPIFLQDHADRVPRLWARRRRRRGMAQAAGISFCARAQAEPFVRAGLIPRHIEVFEIAECSSAFVPGDRRMARELTGVFGDPAVLWVGHLDCNKDPLAVLEGVSAAVARLPGLQLWCCYGSAALLQPVLACIDQHANLRQRVHLLGRVPHARIEHLMRAADLLVSGSRREGSGVAVLEALACGLPPVVSDIPSFRMLTDGGRLGELWPCGDSSALSHALVAQAQRPPGAARSAARGHFDAELSTQALGRKFLDAYRKLIDARAAGRRHSPPAAPTVRSRRRSLLPFK